MKKLLVTICVSGMCEDTFTDKIMIYKPHKTINKEFLLDDCNNIGVNRVSDLLACIKKSTVDLEDLIGTWGMENLSYRTIYVKHEDYLLGLRDDKSLTAMFEYFATDALELVHIVVAGGASIHCGGYMFVVHPRELIHKHLPHVHVERDGFSPRYSLDSIERFPNDKPSKSHSRDEKKIIIPTIMKNLGKFRCWWDMYMHGYIPPAVDENDNQFYQES